MLNLLAVVAAFCAAVMTHGANAGPTRPDDVQAVGAMLDAWHLAAARADEEAYFASLTPDAVFLGTDATERWSVSEFRAFAHPYFAKGRAWTFAARERHITLGADGKTAWFDEALETQNMGECRGSGVAVKGDGGWKVAQYNLTVPIPNELVKDFVARIYEQGLPPAPADAKDELRVMSFNLRYSNSGDKENRWDNRREAVGEFLKRQAPDVVGIQEGLRSQLDDLKAALPGLTQIGVGRDDGKAKGEYAAILYRPDRLRLLEEGTFWFSDTPEVVGSKHWGNRVVRICTWARFEPLDPSLGGPFYHFNLHIDHESQPSRERSVALLLERIAARPHADPVIVTGDFNAGETNRAILAMKGDVPLADIAPERDGAERTRPRFLDSYRVAHPEEKVVGTFNSFKGERDGDKIDYIFVPRSVRVLGAEIHRERPGDRDLSDHFAVSTRLRLPGAGAAR